MHYKRSRSSVKGQGHSVETSSDLHLDVRISIGSCCEIAVYTQYKNGQTQRRTTSRHSQLPYLLAATYSSLIFHGRRKRERGRGGQLCLPCALLFASTLPRSLRHKPGAVHVLQLAYRHSVFDDQEYFGGKKQ